MSIITKSIKNLGKISKDNNIALTDKGEPVDRKAGSLTDKELGKYSVEFICEIRSEDLPNVFFTNKYNEHDRPMINQVKHIIGLNGKSMKIDKIPLSLEEDGDTQLFNHKTTLFKKARYETVCKKYGIRKSNEMEELLKFPYSHNGTSRTNESMRVICFKREEKILVAFLDIHHLLATEMYDDKAYSEKATFCKNDIRELG